MNKLNDYQSLGEAGSSADWLGKNVIFRREVLTKKLLVEHGTMAIGTVYKVVGVETRNEVQHVHLCTDFLPFPFSVEISDIQLIDRTEFHYESMIKPFEHLAEESFSDSEFADRTFVNVNK